MSRQDNLRGKRKMRRARYLGITMLLLAALCLLCNMMWMRLPNSGTIKPSAQQEPQPEPSIPAPPVAAGAINRCSDKDLSLVAKGWGCGSPLSQPCFDFEQCERSRGIYVYDFNCSLSDSSALLAVDEAQRIGEKRDPHFIDWVFRNAAQEAGKLAATYESACLFMHVTRGEKEPCAVKSHLWNDGMNHVMVDFGDNGRERRRPVADSYAMEAASNMHSCVYRTGYDVSLPLGPEGYFHSLAKISPLDRNFFLTTKGTVYLAGYGSEERLSVAPLHDEVNGVIMSMHCFENHGEHLLPANADYCKYLEDRYEDHDYVSLMNSTFGLVPAGRSPGTYRLAEVMGAGVIPVIVARDIVLPFREQFDWPSFSFVFSPDHVGSMVATLRGIPHKKLEEMQRKSLEAYRTMFGGGGTHSGPRAFEPIAKRLINILLQRIHHRGGR